MSAHVREIKGRIGNVENIAQITRAMNAIAMTKVARMKRRLAAVRPYIKALEATVADALGRIPPDTDPHPLAVPNGAAAVGILVLNSDRGLCGRYKGELNQRAEEILDKVSPNGRILAGGEKARQHFARRRIRPLRTYARRYDTPTLSNVEEMADDLIDLYRSGEVGEVRAVYMRFVSDLRQELVVRSMLPVSVEPVRGDAIVEPGATALLDRLLPLYVRGGLYAAILETKASEDAIRRQAMKTATDNAEDLIRILTRSYNRARQQEITLEIADIIGGAEALRTG